MKKYDFDKPVSRAGSNDLKNGVLQERFGRSDLIPLWVADMDWETPEFITAALQKRLQHSLYGYTMLCPVYYQSIIDWQKAHFGWELQRSWISFIPGVVTGIALCINALTQKGDKVIIQPPVYYPFRLVTKANGRQVVNNPLRRKADGSYEMDFDYLASVAEGARMLILCNPHNPGGITWDKATLQRLAQFCYERNIIVVSDEIHGDLALFGNTHTPFATVSPQATAISITLGAPSKTFNIAGIVSSWAIVPDDNLRQRFFSFLEASGHNSPQLFAPIATIAAYQQGDEWRKAMLAYTEENIRFVEDFLAQHLPQIRPLRPQASFLVWLDCTALNMSQKELVHFFVHEAGLALNDGSSFGPGGEGYMRLNVGTQRSVLQQALDQLLAAFLRREQS